MSDEKLNGTAAAPAGADGEPTPIIFLDDIRVTFKTRTGSILHPNKVQAVRGLTLKLMPGQTLGIVGESGCGKSTTALDVTVQKQVIDLLNKLQKELGFAMVFVSHDLALVAEVANSITVMYAGQVVEQGPVTDILCHPVHEYTRGLLGSVLSIEAGGARLHQVPGSVPSPKDFPEGDRFTPRSSHPDKVSQLRPVLKRVEGTDHYYGELPDSELKRLGIKPYVPGGPLI